MFDERVLDINDMCAFFCVCRESYTNDNVSFVKDLSAFNLQSIRQDGSLASGNRQLRALDGLQVAPMALDLPLSLRK